MRNMRHLAQFLLPTLMVTWLAAGSNFCNADDESLGFELALDVGHLGDYTFGDFALYGAIQDEGSAFGQYAQMPDGTFDLQLSLSGRGGDMLLVLHKVHHVLNPDWSTSLASDFVTLEGETGEYVGVTGSGSALGDPYVTDSWWGWGYPSERESWLVIGELSGPLPPPPPPPLPGVAIDDVSIVEGRRGTRSARFTVSLSSASEEPVSVEYATADGSALVSNRDYEPLFGVLKFEPGETSATIAVQVCGDRKREPDERFFVDLVNPSGAALADDEGIGTILNDD